MNKNNCYFYNLPEELQKYIFDIVKNDAAQTIITYWYIYIQKKVIAINLILKLPTVYLPHWEYDTIIETYSPSRNQTVYNFIYCNKVLSGNEDAEWWNAKLTKLKNGLDWWLNYIIINSLDDIPKRAINNLYYSERIWSNLYKKFNE